MAEVEIKLDTSTWTQEQKNLLQAITYSLAYSAGDDNVPTVKGDTVVFIDPKFDTKLITEQVILDKIAVDELERANKDIEFNNKLSELVSLETELNTYKSTWDTLSDSDKIKSVQKILRYILLKVELQ